MIRCESVTILFERLDNTTNNITSIPNTTSVLWRHGIEYVQCTAFLNKQRLRKGLSNTTCDKILCE